MRFFVLIENALLDAMEQRSIKRIQPLSSVVANQIAAGEVIERPASVVKELLENALDAGADVISVEIGAGGLSHVKVSDNGHGIVAEDLHLAVAAHATSKIRQLSDLCDITSMGFRGEALASIASVSRLSVRSKPEEQAHAMLLEMDGAAIRVVPCARRRGTTIEVRDLFYNAPVRKKFLKTERGEFQAIDAVVRRFALSAPHLALSLRHNDKLLLDLPAATCERTRLQRIRKLLGKSFVDQSVYLDVERAGLRLHGFVCGSGYLRSQNDKQWVYINQRMVKDKLLNHAVKQAYEPILYPGRYPACLLYLTMLPEEVDVNVHPTKHEVRFQQPRLVHDFMTSQLVQALAEISPVDHSLLTKVARSVPMKSSRHSEIPVRTRSSWLTLNQQFACCDVDGNSYLVDARRLQTLRQTALLRDETRPLLSRPLLVPLHYSIDGLNEAQADSLQRALLLLGVSAELVNAYQLRVCSIPLLFPALDVSRFLSGCTRHLQQGLNELEGWFIECQSFDLYQLNEDEQSVLSAYAEQALLISGDCGVWSVPLTIDACHAFWEGRVCDE